MVEVSDVIGFADIIAPISEEDFFANFYDQKPVHIKGAADKFSSIMSWSILQDLLNCTGIWSSTSLALVIDRETIGPRAYCNEVVGRDGASILQPDPGKVMTWLNRGASLVANDIDTLTGPLRDIASAFEETYGAKVQANLYCSWPQRQAFDSHFDTHDVFAVHVEGTKTWRVYEGRMPHPIRHPRFTSFSNEDHQRQRGAVMMEVEMAPGDLLYLPRGWYHDALADSGDGSVHIAFGLTSVIGMDYLGALSDLLVGEEAFRRNFPIPGAGKEAFNAHLAELAEVLGNVARNPKLTDMMQQFQASFRYPRGGITLPVHPEDPKFSLIPVDARLEARNGSPVLTVAGKPTAVPAPIAPMLQWVIETRVFARSMLTTAFKTQDVSIVDKFLSDMLNMGLLRRES